MCDGSRAEHHYCIWHKHDIMSLAEASWPEPKYCGLFFFFSLADVDIFFCDSQEVKKAILSDMTKLGREAGLKSFEQVNVSVKEQHKD